MKELSIEEKAKRYDEAIERARTEYKNHEAFKGFCEMLVNIFPELKGSEDEKIRKQIISFLKEFEYDHYRSLDFSSWIAWLEKQGKQKSNIIWHNVSEEPDVQREIFCEWRNDDNVWHDVVFYHADTKTFWDGEHQIEDVVKWIYVDEMLKKQGEHNVFDYENVNIRQKDFAPKSTFEAINDVNNAN